MEQKNRIGSCILGGLVAVALALPLAVRTYTSSQRNVTVKGLCEKEVTADRAIWPIVYKEGGNALATLAASVEAKNRTITDWLGKAGFDKSEISVGAPKVEDTRTGYYDQRTFDYIMTSVITVCTSKVDLVRQMQTRQFDLLGQGIAIGGGSSWEYPVTYEYTRLNDIKPEMIEQATVNARQAADKFAKDSGSRVGRINSASQGQFTITDRDSNTPYIKNIRVVTSVNYRLR